MPLPYTTIEWSSRLPSPSGVFASFLQEVSDRRPRVILVELREPVDVRRNPRVVRRVVEPLVHAALRIEPIAELARDHERPDSREVRFPREREQVEHQHRVLLEVGRNAVRLVRHVDPRERGVGRERDPALELAHVRRDSGRCARGRRRADRASAKRPRPSRNRAGSRAAVAVRRAPPACCRRRAGARTRRAGSSPSAAAFAASDRRSTSRPRARARATAAASPGRRAARRLGRPTSATAPCPRACT